MIKEFDCIVTDVKHDFDTRRAIYTLEYAEDGQVKHMTVTESDACVTEEGDRVRVIIDEDGTVHTSIPGTLKKRDHLMLLTLAGIIAVIAVIIALFLLIDNLVFRIVLAALVAGFLIFINNF